MMDTKNLVFVSKDEYEMLIGKAAIYDAYARKLKADADRGGYVSEYEQAMFVVDAVDVTDIMLDIVKNIEELDEEGMEEFFTDEEWQKVVEIAEEEEK